MKNKNSCGIINNVIGFTIILLAVAFMILVVLEVI